jgi:hypothetical protein
MADTVHNQKSPDLLIGATGPDDTRIIKLVQYHLSYFLCLVPFPLFLDLPCALYLMPFLNVSSLFSLAAKIFVQQHQSQNHIDHHENVDISIVEEFTKIVLAKVHGHVEV